MSEIKFGPWSVALALFAGQALILAAALLARPLDRSANAWLAGLLIVMAGMMMPYIIGYAGFYDAFPWLSFAPFAIPLAVGPLLYGHVNAVLRRRAIGWTHAILPGAQFAWQAICFTQPLATKIWIDATIQEPFLTPLTSVAVVLSMGGYALASFYVLRKSRRGGKRDAALSRLRIAVIAILGLVSARAGFDLYDAMIASLDYFDVFAFYVLLALVTTLLGVEGWRGSALPLPSFAGPAVRDWPSEARSWEMTLRREGWWREPDLDLPGLARRLGTNSSYVSRGLNEGLGIGFADLLGVVRAEAVAARIDSGASEDLLTLAFDAGFGSKASFNRAFAKRFGQSPSAYRDASQRKKLASAGM